MGSLSALNKYLWRYRGYLLLGTVFVVLSNYFGIYPAQVVRHAFNLIRENLLWFPYFRGTGLESSFYGDFGKVLLLFGGIVLALAFLRGVFLFLMRQTIIVVSRKVEYDLKNDIYAHYQKMSRRFYRSHATGDLMNRIGEDVSRVRMYLGPGILYGINLTSLFVLVVTIMFSVNPRLTLYSCLPLPVLAFVIFKVNNRINFRSEKIQEKLSGLSSYVQEAFSGIRIIKGYGKERAFVKDFDGQANDYQNESMGLVRLQAFFFPTMTLLIGLSILLTVYIGGIEVIKGRITAGNIAEFIMYVSMLTWPVTSLGWISSLIQRAEASQRRINEFLDTEPEIQAGNGRQAVLKGNLEVQDLKFTYPETGVKALQGVSFKIRQGQVLGVLGKTGSGKSTLFQLLQREMDPDGGQILYDNTPIAQLEPSVLRRSLAVVPQQSFLFSDTILNNITFGVDDFTKEEVEEVLHTVCLDEVLDTFPQGMETRIGERGITLSGGQKQRVSLARALMVRAPFLLLDDCFSAIDTRTEELILNRISARVGQQTVLIVSHRVSTLKNAHHIIVMDKGRILEQGDHRRLLDAKGLYAAMERMQRLEELHV